MRPHRPSSRLDTHRLFDLLYRCAGAEEGGTIASSAAARGEKQPQQEYFITNKHKSEYDK